jgi:hypothetical protein
MGKLVENFDILRGVFLHKNLIIKGLLLKFNN